jgi:hypothetical protein
MAEALRCLLTRMTAGARFCESHRLVLRAPTSAHFSSWQSQNSNDQAVDRISQRVARAAEQITALAEHAKSERIRLPAHVGVGEYFRLERFGRLY